MNFNTYLKENAQHVNKILEKILSDFLKGTKNVNPKLIPFAKAFVNSCHGGKRIRGVLCKLGYELGNPKGSQEILKVGAAFEILHTSLLIHDDIIDQSPSRRDQPSLYMALGGQHYGISQAITLGDIGLYLPIKIITETAFSDKAKLKAINYFSQILINTGWGQIMDVEDNPNTTFINLFKTAKYTIAGPLQIGAILAGAGDKLINELGMFGENLGIAYQIQDDILDGEVKEIDTAKIEVLEYTTKAQGIISKITSSVKMCKLLEQMTDYLVKRDK